VARFGHAVLNNTRVANMASGRAAVINLPTYEVDQCYQPNARGLLDCGINELV